MNDNKKNISGFSIDNFINHESNTKKNNIGTPKNNIKVQKKIEKPVVVPVKIKNNFNKEVKKDEDLDIYKEFVDEEDKKKDNKFKLFFINLKSKFKSFHEKESKKEIIYRYTIIGLVVLIVFVGLLIVYNRNNNDFAIGEKFDFEENVVIKDGKNKFSLEQFLVCSATRYISFDESVDDYPSKYELLSAYYVYSKASLLKNGYYSIKHETIDYNDIKDYFPNYDPTEDCIMNEEYDNVDEFLAKKFNNIYVAAYYVVYNNVLVPNSFNVSGEELLSDSIIYKNSSEIGKANQYISTWNKNLGSNKYQTLIKKTHSKYYIYSLYDNKYLGDVSNNGVTNGVWPIGSSKASSGNLYLNKPVTSEIVENHGKNGIEVKVNTTANVVSVYNGIVSKTGQVQNLDDSIKGLMPNESFQNYVEITHDNGLVSFYGNLDNNLQVKAGDNVKQGQLLGTISQNNNLYLYFLKDDVLVTPLDYVSIDNPRPNIGQYITFVKGSNNKQSICLSLKASGFDNNAVAAVLANIQSESGFRNSSCGDYVNGVATSYGIIQWHNGRFNNLIKYSGESNTNFYSYKNGYCNNTKYAFSDLSVQLNYMMKELNSSYYRKILNVLNSNNTARYKGYYWCYYYEVPAKRDKTCDAVRGVNAQNVMLKYVKNNCS